MKKLLFLLIFFAGCCPSEAKWELVKEEKHEGIVKIKGGTSNWRTAYFEDGTSETLNGKAVIIEDVPIDGKMWAVERLYKDVNWDCRGRVNNEYVRKVEIHIFVDGTWNPDCFKPKKLPQPRVIR